MENPNKISQLSSFLKKVQRLRGYGDMDSYYLVKEFKQLADLPDNSVNTIISDFSSPRTWSMAKMNFIDKVESVIGDAYNA